MKRGKLSEFEAYIKDCQEMTFRSRNEIERDGTQAALARCRALALQIQLELSRKKVDDFVDLMALADFQVSIERAAFVLERSKVEN
jgi:molecular chaperone DnaK (HSP70)